MKSNFWIELKYECNWNSLQSNNGEILKSKLIKK